MCTALWYCWLAYLGEVFPLCPCSRICKCRVRAPVPRDIAVRFFGNAQESLGNGSVWIWFANAPVRGMVKKFPGGFSIFDGTFQYPACFLVRTVPSNRGSLSPLFSLALPWYFSSVASHHTGRTGSHLAQPSSDAGSTPWENACPPSASVSARPCLLSLRPLPLLLVQATFAFRLSKKCQWDPVSRRRPR